MISDKDILVNLKALQEKVDGISIKAKENIPLMTSETETKTVLPSLPSIPLNYLMNFLYVFIPISIFGLLYYFKPSFVMTETKIDTFLTKTEISYLLISACTFVICFVIFFIIFIMKFKG
jgi:ABC-type multidrug transport system permease subunit